MCDCVLQSVGSTGGREMHALKRGLLWQQRERLFSRWKERFFILTKDYLHCFKKSTGLSPMGQFIFKVERAPSHFSNLFISLYNF